MKRFSFLLCMVPWCAFGALTSGPSVGFSPLSVSAVTDPKYAHVLTPSAFGAKCDGVTDDTLALSNMFAAFNSGTNGRVIDGFGLTNLISSSPPSVSIPHATVRNLCIFYGSTNGYAIGHTNDGMAQNFTIENCFVKYLPTNVPAEDSVGINCGVGYATHNAYWDNLVVQDCTVVGFRRNVVTGNATQYSIQRNCLWGAWSNCVYMSIAGTAMGDSGTISQNDMDQAMAEDLGFSSVAKQTNVVAIRCDSGAHALTISQNNIGRVRQVLVIHGGYVHMIKEQDGGFMTADTNICPYELWDCPINVEFSAVADAGTTSSNYVGLFGLYGAVNVNPLSSHFGKFIDINIAPFYNTLAIDMWQGNPRPCTGGSDYPQIDPQSTTVQVNWHSSFGDSGAKSILASVPFGMGWNGTNYQVRYDHNSLVFANSSGLWGTWSDQYNQLVVSGGINAVNCAGVALPSGTQIAGGHDSGGYSYWDWSATYTKRWRWDSLGAGIADLEGSNGVLFAYAPLKCTNTVTVPSMTVSNPLSWWSAITNQGMVWFAFQTNNTPAVTGPNGSWGTSTNGQMWIMVNGSWTAK